MYIIVLLAVLVALAVGAATLVYRRARRFGRGWASLASLVCLLLLVPLIPLPVHSGFSFVFEVLVSEFGRQQIARDRSVQSARRQSFLQELEARFAGPLPHDALGPAEEGWQRVAVTGAARAAWLEPESQLIWSEAFPWREAVDFSLVKPRAFCHALAPAGYWALPSEAELALFWHRGGAAATGGPAFNAASFSVDDELLIVLPAIHLGRRTLRCVARTARTPARGYIDSDISLSDWNDYQLAKMAGGEGR